jgi:methylase of polypeptide subunit release factors
VDEDAPEVDGLDPGHWPNLYAGGHAGIAGGHLMALGHVLVRSELQGKARILEYGAGFGQLALAFARLGHTVDTVDINPSFCSAVGALSARYGVDLTPHIGPFGFNPARLPGAYDLIF